MRSLITLTSQNSIHSRPFIGFFLHYCLQIKNNLKFKILDLCSRGLLSFLLFLTSLKMSFWGWQPISLYYFGFCGISLFQCTFLIATPLPGKHHSSCPILIHKYKLSPPSPSSDSSPLAHLCSVMILSSSIHETPFSPYQDFLHSETSDKQAESTHNTNPLLSLSV